MPACLRSALLLASILVSVPAAAQQPCFFSISPNSASFGAAGGTGLVLVTASAGSCSRQVVSNAPWITVSYGQTGTGDGSAGYDVKPNNTPVSRTGTLSVAGQVLTVTQAAGTCSIQVSPSRTTIPSGGGSGSFSVTTECSWTVSSAASWLTLLDSMGSGAGSVRWTAAANTTTSQRTGTITIGSAAFTIVQDASCVFILSGPTSPFPGAGGTGTITVQGSSVCERTAASDAGWITVTSGTAGQGNGSIGFTVAANTSTAQRVGNIRVNDTAYPISQAANRCSLSLAPTRAPGSVSGGVGTFAVNSNCLWTAVSKSDWVRLTGTTSGSGSATVSYEYAANYSAIGRGGFIQVNEATFVIDQPGASCDVDLSPENVTVAADGSPGTVRVSLFVDCNWTAVPTVEWISTSRGASGTGTGTVEYSIAANQTTAIRTGSILIGNKAFQVRQAAANCNVSAGAVTMQVPTQGETRTLPISANCSWTAEASAGWIRFLSASSGSASASLTFVVSPNSGPEERRGSITVNGQTVTIVQAGLGCSLTLSDKDLVVPPRGGSGVVNVSGNTSCNWSAASTVDWLVVDWSSVSGTGLVRYSAGANTSGAERTALIGVSGQTVTVRQNPLVVAVTAQGIVNAASFAGGTVAPGEVVTIYGSGFGPAMVSGPQLNTGGTAVATMTGDTQVLFDGVAAAMIYAAAGQLSAVVPYAVAGRPTTTVEVRYLGVGSNRVTLPVAPAAPGVFTLAASGAGPAAALNQDYTLNGPEAPAARGSVLQIFATGEGETLPAGVDGRLAVGLPQLPAPVLPVRVRIGGEDAEVLYAGAAPGMVAGIIQVNARVPQTVRTGSQVPVVILVGEAESRPGPTVSIR